MSGGGNGSGFHVGSDIETIREATSAAKGVDRSVDEVLSHLKANGCEPRADGSWHVEDASSLFEIVDPADILTIEPA